jgi:hypothetical protein
MEELPEPGTLEDLIADASMLGWGTNERMLRDWKRMGLLASPAKRSLGRGLGLAPGIYSDKQRAIFRLLVHNKRDGAKNEQLAKAVVYLWLNQDDDWVDSEQALAAVLTAIGNPKKSQRIAGSAARDLVNSIDLAGATIVDRRKLTNLITDQLSRGDIKPERLAPLISAILDRPGVTVVRGPSGAQLTTDAIVQLLSFRASAASRIQQVTAHEMDEVRAEHQITWAQYQTARPTLYAMAGAETKHLFDEPSGIQLLNEAVPITLFLLGALHQRTGTQT